MYNNTISGTATEKGGNDNRDSIIVHVVLYCNYIIITSFFSCCARDSIIVYVVLYCNYIIITSFFRCCARDSIIVYVVLYLFKWHIPITPNNNRCITYHFNFTLKTLIKSRVVSIWTIHHH
jgi:hypothetical protein